MGGDNTFPVEYIMVTCAGGIGFWKHLTVKVVPSNRNKQYCTKLLLTKDYYVFSSLSVATTLDRHQGTPMLLEGVRCIGVELEYDSEQSDWQGFD